jgi:uncharacterized membrane protein YfcA
MTGVELTLLLSGAFVAGVISAIAGFGGGILYLPLVVALVGPREAVPLVTFGLMFSNLTRVSIHWKSVVWPLAIRYIIGAIPGAALGAVVFVKLPADWITKGIGVFLIGSVVFLKLQKENRPPLTRWGIFYPLGAAVGFFSNMLGVVGPMAVPFFLATGIRKEAFVGTMAFGALLMHVTGVTTWTAFDVISRSTVFYGLLMGALMVIGTYAGTALLKRFSSKVFMYVVEGLLVVIGALFLAK